MVPARWAWFKAPLPRTTVSRCEDPPPVLLPIFVTVSQSSDMAALLDEFEVLVTSFYGREDEVVSIYKYEMAFLIDDSIK